MESGILYTLVMRTCDPNTPPVSEDIARNYFQAALEGWSAQWQPVITTLKSLNVEESCLCIGVFKRDLPAGDKQLKELGMSAKEVYKEIPNTPRKTSSATGASAFQLQGTVRTTPVTPQKYSARKEGQPAYCVDLVFSLLLVISHLTLLIAKERKYQQSISPLLKETR
jgi:hypothetical protein